MHAEPRRGLKPAISRFGVVECSRRVGYWPEASSRGSVARALAG